MNVIIVECFGGVRSTSHEQGYYGGSYYLNFSPYILRNRQEYGPYILKKEKKNPIFYKNIGTILVY
jgi:hypothetical protein